MATGYKTFGSGRKKGTPNKKTANLKELIEENYEGFDPIIELIKVSKQENLPVDLKVSILKTVSEFIHAKRKAIEAEIETEVKHVKTYEETLFEIIHAKENSLAITDV